MVFDPKHETLLNQLADEIRLAPAPTGGLFSKITRNACIRLPVLSAAGKTGQFNRLVGMAAWTDASLALIELELPGWTLRRLAYEDGEWTCSLSKEPNLPLEIDDTADADHEVLTLAILGAFVEARRRFGVTEKTASTTVPQVKPLTTIPACCDNFA